MTVRQEIHKITEASPFVNLYKIDLTRLNGPIVYLTDNVNGIVLFDGQSYQPSSIELSGLDVNAESSSSTPTVQIEHLGGPILAYINAYSDLAGAQFYRIRTYQKFLDGQSAADPTQTLPMDKFLIERMSSLDAVSATFELKPVLSFSELKLPKRIILRNACDFIYRRPYFNGTAYVYDYSKATCPAGAGQGAYTFMGVSTTIQNDVCAKSLSACKLRFGASAELPFRGYPGVNRTR